MTSVKKRHLKALQEWPKKHVLKQLFQVGWPISLDQLSFSTNMICLFWVLGQIGTEAVAIAHVVITCVLALYLPGLGFGMAAMSLVGEALGKGSPSNAKKPIMAVSTISITLIDTIPNIIGVDKPMI